MKTATPTILDLSSLPEQARQELADFYQFLKKKYRSPKVKPVTDIGTQLKALKDAGFVGMWKDREDMKDSTDWVRKLRESAWSRHE